MGRRAALRANEGIRMRRFCFSLYHHDAYRSPAELRGGDGRVIVCRGLRRTASDRPGRAGDRARRRGATCSRSRADRPCRSPNRPRRRAAGQDSDIAPQTWMKVGASISEASSNGRSARRRPGAPSAPPRRRGTATARATPARRGRAVEPVGLVERAAVAAPLDGADLAERHRRDLDRARARAPRAARRSAASAARPSAAGAKCRSVSCATSSRSPSARRLPSTRMSRRNTRSPAPAARVDRRDPARRRAPR